MARTFIISDKSGNDIDFFKNCDLGGLVLIDASCTKVIFISDWGEVKCMHDDTSSGLIHLLFALLITDNMQEGFTAYDEMDHTFDEKCLYLDVWSRRGSKRAYNREGLRDFMTDNNWHVLTRKEVEKRFFEDYRVTD